VTRGHLIIYLEDPGAAGFARPVLEALKERGQAMALMAAPGICAYLAAGGLSPVPVTAPDQAVMPDGALLIVGTSANPDSAGLRWIDEARARGIASLALIDFTANAGKRFRGRGQDPFHHRPDHLVVVDGQTRDAFVALGFPAHAITVTGNPHFDAVAGRARLLDQAGRGGLRQLLGWPDDRPIALFLSEPQVRPGFAAYSRTPHYYFPGRGTRQGRSEIMIEEFLDATSKLSPVPWRVIRFHPREDPAAYHGLAQEFDAIDGSGEGLLALTAADIVCGMSTSMLIDSAILGRPTLSLTACPDEETWLPQDPRGPVRKARSRQELEAFLSNPTCLPPVPAADFSATANVLAAIDALLTRP